MPARKNAAWTDQWLRELSWPELVDMNQKILAAGIQSRGLMGSRARRLQKELERRNVEVRRTLATMNLDGVKISADPECVEVVYDDL